MLLHGSWHDKVVDLGGRYDQNVCLPGTSDVFSLRIKAALLTGIALSVSAATALRVRLRRLDDLSDMTFSDGSDWTLHDFYYMEV